MKFKYTGDAKSLTLRGVEFAKGKSVAVDDPSLAKKLANMPDFQEVKNAKNKK
jgi:hypothetical protein